MSTFFPSFLRVIHCSPDFTNPNDSEDKRFEPHPTDYSVMKLEYPNIGACERFVLLVPKDKAKAKDHYNPIMCLENTLHAILESMRSALLCGQH
ncbi:hypothetical protein BKA93DRAFT_734905 [Sparassis latifolia]